MNISRNLMLWAIILVCVVALFNLFQGSAPRNSSREIYFSDFMAAVERDIAGHTVRVLMQAASNEHALAPR